MDPSEFFATEWVAMTPRLRAKLARAGARHADQDDLLQETALRLLHMWDAIDWSRGADALATRIAVNAWRDEWRRRGAHEVLGDIPDAATGDATERTAIARIEVRDVSVALASLRPDLAALLRNSVTMMDDPRPVAASAAVRMARTRARRALAACLQVASAVGAAVAGSRALLRTQHMTPAAVAVGAAATVAFALGVVSSAPHAPHGQVGSTPSKVRLQPAGATAPALGAIRARARGASLLPRDAVLLVSTRQAPAKDPYYDVSPVPQTRAGVWLQADVNGSGVEVSKPRPGSQVPVCTDGVAVPGVHPCSG